MNHRIVVVTIQLLLISTSLFAQSAAESFESALIPKKGGAVVVYSGDSHSFTVDIISDDIKPLDHPGMVIVDNKTLQFVCIGYKVVKENGTAEEIQKTQLLTYMQYELDYVKNDVNMDYTDLHKYWVVINDKIFLLWYYNMPADNKSVLKQINLSTLCFTHVLNLNTPFVNGDNFDDDKGLLLKVAQTLKQNNFKISFDDLYKKLNPK